MPLLLLLPFLILLVLIFGRRWPVAWAAPVACLSLLAVAMGVWGMSLPTVGAALLQSFFVTFDILIILIGAVFLLEAIRRAEALSVLKDLVWRWVPDRRLQIILLGWFLVALIEGLAGFGTPALLVAPLLVTIGFPPLAAATLTLVSNSVPVVFGAMGTPLLIGVGSGLDLQSLSLDPHQLPLLLSTVGGYAVFLNLLAGLLMPLVLSCLLTGWFGKSWRQGFAVWPYALLAGISFVIPYGLALWWWGPEFPAVIGALVGGGIMLILTRLGWGRPASAWDFDNSSIKQVSSSQSPTQVLKAFAPYIFVTATLLVSRYFNILVLSPGIYLMLAAGLVLWLYHFSWQKSWQVVTATGQKLLPPLLALIFLSAMVQIFIFSSDNTAGLPSMPLYAANSLASIMDQPAIWILTAPLVGLFGALITGSLTVSTLLFAQFQWETASALGLSPYLGLALQLVGGAGGNMIAFHNVVVVLAAVGLSGREWWVIKRNLPIALIYGLTAGVLALLLAAVTQASTHL